MLNPDRAEEILGHFSSKKIMVFGDVILDRYLFGAVDRISPEAPVPVVKIKEEEFRLGGCGNVALNIDRLGARSILVGVTGNDHFARMISQLKPIDNQIVKSVTNSTIVKTRVISNKQQIVRIDREKEIRITKRIEQQLIQNILDNRKVNGIILSDYAKGTLTGKLMETLATVARQEHIPLIVDPKPPNFSIYQGITAVTPNKKEAEILLNKPIRNDTDIKSALEEIIHRFSCPYCLITRGDEGISAIDSTGAVFHIPAITHEVYDVTGAGDTVVSVLLLSLLGKGSLKESVILANVAASMVVEKLGTSAVTSEEIRQKISLMAEN